MPNFRRHHEKTLEIHNKKVKRNNGALYEPILPGHGLIIILQNCFHLTVFGFITNIINCVKNDENV